MLLYIALSEPNVELSFDAFCALVYLADRHHLRRNGRMISGSQYIAVKNHPPIPIDIVKNIQKFVALHYKKIERYD